MDRSVAEVGVLRHGEMVVFFLDVEWGTMICDDGFTITATDCVSAWTIEADEVTVNLFASQCQMDAEQYRKETKAAFQGMHQDRYEFSLVNKNEEDDSIVTFKWKILHEEGIKICLGTLHMHKEKDSISRIFKTIQHLTVRTMALESQLEKSKQTTEALQDQTEEMKDELSNFKDQVVTDEEQKLDMFVSILNARKRKIRRLYPGGAKGGDTDFFHEGSMTRLQKRRSIEQQELDDMETNDDFSMDDPSTGRTFGASSRTFEETQTQDRSPHRPLRLARSLTTDDLDDI